MIEIFYSLFGSKVIRKKYVSFLRIFIFLADLTLLSFSLALGFTKVSIREIDEIMGSFVKKFLVLTIACTALIIILQSWMKRHFESELEDNLKKFEVLLSAEKGSKSSVENKFQSWKLMNLFQLILCLCFSIVPLFCDKVYGIWEVLLYSILLMKTTSIRYAFKVGKIREKIKKMREEIHSLVKLEDEVDSFTKNFSLSRENFRDHKMIEIKIKNLMKCQNVIVSLVSSCNERFGLSILAIVFSAFLSLTYCGYNFFIEIETERSKKILIGKFCSFMGNSNDLVT